MTQRLLAVILLAACAFLPPVKAQKRSSDAEIQAAIARLSSNSGSEPVDAPLHVLYDNPERSTELLIAALKPTPPGKYLTGRHPEAVWLVRALRSLTGLDFTATTKAQLSSDEAYFLGSNARDQVSFFGTWMSRDTVWVAPKDAQIAIIKQWQDWFAKHGHNYKYVNDRDFNDWYF